MTPPALLQVLAGTACTPPPLWLMRQAGRYLPEYRALRERAGDFLSLCMNPDWACEVTLQPIKRFDFDAAILFSDILVVPLAMGQKLWFEPGEGPRLEPALATTQWQTLGPHPAALEPIYATVRKVRAALAPSKALIGFAGSPWTVATYMVAGGSTKDHAPARLAAYRDPTGFKTLIDAIVAQTVAYLAGQVAAGVDVLMLFDSWAGVLPPDQFEQWVIAPTVDIIKALRARGITTPIIGFPRGAGLAAAAYARETGIQGLGVEEQMELPMLLKLVPPSLAIQGNIDALALQAGGAALDRAIDTVRAQCAGRPHILNLGHGITPSVPLEHVQQLIHRVRS